jgi:inosine-uridine nucleoside N-ribohydrolase
MRVRERTPVIVDTDIGEDIDDTWAVVLLARDPRIDLRLVVTSTDDTRAKACLAAKVLARVGRGDVPVAIGIPTSDRRLTQAEWLGAYRLEQYEGDVFEDGVGAMIDCIYRQADAPAILALGPQTNVAAALSREPGIGTRSRVVATAGSIYSGYGGLAKACAESNVLKDVEAARAVLAGPWEATWSPLDLCGTLTMDGTQYEAIKASDATPARVVVETFEQWAHRPMHLGKGTTILYDTAAVYLAASEALCEIVKLPIVIDNRGYTRVTDGGRSVRCALSWKDRCTFERWLMTTLLQDDS